MSDFHLKNKENSKKALVLSGGGARGSFEIGVWKALNEIGYFPDIVTGISVGALNGALIVRGDLDEAEKMWEEIQTHHILDYELPIEITSFKDYRKAIRGFLIKAISRKGVSSKPLKDLIDEFLNNEKSIRNKNIEFGIVVTNYLTKERKGFYLDEIKNGQLNEVLLASASLFPAMEKTYINQIPYVDGGYENHVPIDLALERNPDELIIVDLQPERNMVIKTDDKDKHITVIQSKWYLGDLLIFDQTRNELNIALGYNETMKAAGKYDGNLYTIDEKNIEKEYKHFYRALNRLLEGEVLQTLHSYIIKEKNQIALLNSCSEKWGENFDEKTFPLAILEVTAKTFHVSPEKVYTMKQLQLEVLRAVLYYMKSKPKQIPEELVPDFIYGAEEWKEYHKNYFSLLSDREVIQYIVELLVDKNIDFTELKYQVLFRIKPLSLLLALYIYYLLDKTKI